MKCPECHGSGRVWPAQQAEVVGHPGTPCGSCDSAGDVPFDHVRKSDGFVASCVTFYAALYPRLRQVAFEHGYALPVHGSLAKDLDVVAVPWTDRAGAAEELAQALIEAAGGFALGEPTTKHHGRRCWTIHLGRDGGYIDLSVMPRVEPA